MSLNLNHGPRRPGTPEAPAVASDPAVPATPKGGPRGVAFNGTAGFRREASLPPHGRAACDIDGWFLRGQP